MSETENSELSVTWASNKQRSRLTASFSASLPHVRAGLNSDVLSLASESRTDSFPDQEVESVLERSGSVCSSSVFVLCSGNDFLTESIYKCVYIIYKYLNI